MADWQITAVHALLIFTALVGFLAACNRDRAAIALCLNLCAAMVMEWSALAFHPLVWSALDVAVCIALLRPGMTNRNLAIVMLYPIAWVGYFGPEPWPFIISSVVVAAQFLLAGTSIPWLKVWHRARSTPMPDHRTPFDMRVTCDV